MPKKLLADVNESESEYDHDHDTSESVVQTLSKLDIQPGEKKTRTLTEEHKAKLLAGRLKASEKRKLENKFGKSGIDRKLQLLEKHGLLKDERLTEFNNIYEELTGDIRISKPVKIGEILKDIEVEKPVRVEKSPPPVMAEKLLEKPNIEIPKPTRAISIKKSTILKEPKYEIEPPVVRKPRRSKVVENSESENEILVSSTPRPQKKNTKSEIPVPGTLRVPPRRQVQFETEVESQSELDESDYEPVKKPMKKSVKVPSESEFSTSAEVESDSDLDTSYFDMNIFNGFGQEPPQRQFNMYR
jgi:hypothetical protein